MATDDATTASCAVSDVLVGVQLIECAPALDAADVRVRTVLDAPPLAVSPTQAAAEATITQTGADPPPLEGRD